MPSGKTIEHIGTWLKRYRRKWYFTKLLYVLLLPVGTNAIRRNSCRKNNFVLLWSSNGQEGGLFDPPKYTHLKPEALKKFKWALKCNHLENFGLGVEGKVDPPPFSSIYVVVQQKTRNTTSWNWSVFSFNSWIRLLVKLFFLNRIDHVDIFV